MLPETTVDTLIWDEFDLDLQILPAIDTELPDAYASGSCDCPAPKPTYEADGTCNGSCPETCGGNCTWSGCGGAE